MKNILVQVNKKLLRVSLISVAVLLAITAPHISFAQKPLQGISCDKEIRNYATNFQSPLKPVDGKEWGITNNFGEVSTSLEISGLENGYWQHTGIDYVLERSTQLSQRESVYAASNGVVVFSTNSNINPVPKRGGLVIIKHIAPQGKVFRIPKFIKNLTAGKESLSFSYESFDTREIFTYYLHLDPTKIFVNQGDEVASGQLIAQLYSYSDFTNKTFSYKPHLHFEVWKACPKTERNGYDTYGNEFQEGLDTLLINPSDVIEKNILISITPEPPIEIASVPTLFLLDTSGSMRDNNKIEQARTAALDALNEIRWNVKIGVTQPPLSVFSFAGNCNLESTRKLLAFTPNIEAADSTLRTRLPAPDGATPSPQAVQVATAEMEAFLQSRAEYSEGRIVLLSDGQSTCGNIRPPDVYSITRHDISVTGNRLNSRIKYLCIGFDVPAGSAAERDLQYLASKSGGKYFHARDRRQLIRAFQKLLRVFLPKRLPQISSIGSARADFDCGLRAMTQRNYKEALRCFRAFAKAHPNNPTGLYNLAVALEATDHYKGAAEHYRRYLNLQIEAHDVQEIQRRISQLQQDYIDQLNYYIDLLRSDLAYLKVYYQSLFNRSNKSLAEEFYGFVFEKRDFYKSLPDILEREEPWLKSGSRDLADALDMLAGRVNLNTFDRDAVSLLTIPIAQLEDLISRIERLSP